MNKKLAAPFAAALLVLTAFAGGVIFSMDSSPTDTPTSESVTPTPQPMSAADAPEDAQKSVEGAKLLKQKMIAAGYPDARVFVKPDGTIVATFSSNASNGPELKNDIKDIALQYSEVRTEYPEAGGLTIAANGVAALVSEDTSLAHSEGRLKDDAYFKTISYKTYETDTETPEG